MAKVSAKRERVWREHGGRCHWCGRRTVLKPKDVSLANMKETPPDLATVDHLWSKFHPSRCKGFPGPMVLACHECNNVRNEIDQFLHLGEHLRRTYAGQRGEQADRWLERTLETLGNLTNGTART